MKNCEHGLENAALGLCMESQMAQNSRKKNLSHIQQNCYQSPERFQSSSTRSVHIQPIFIWGQHIKNQA